MSSRQIDNEKQTNAINEVFREFALNGNAFEVFDKMNTLLLEITDSEYGFIGEVMNDGTQDYLKTQAITNISWNKETRTFYEENAPNGLEFKNLKSLFGRVLTSKSYVISNDPANDPRRAGLPPGHPRMDCFLGIPFSMNDQLTGMVGIANRPGGYNEEIVKELEPFTNACASLIEGYRLIKIKNETTSRLNEAFSKLQEKNEKLSEFTYIVGHDVRKHATNLKMLSNMLQSDPDEEKKAMAEGMLFKSIDHLNSTVNYISGILNVNSKLNMTKREIDIQEFLQDILNSFEVELKDFNVFVTPIAFKLNIEPVYLNSICENIISNAIKYRRKENPELKIILKEENNEVSISFEDNGIGFNAQEKGTEIFKLFTSFHHDPESKGIGLHLVKKHVDALNGKINVESQEGQGAKFLITLPKND